MRFCGKMNHPVYFEGFENSLNKLFVTNVAFNEVVTFRKILLHIGQIGEIAGIGEQVEIDHLDMVCPLENMPHKIAADEPTAACDKYFHAGFAF